MPRLTDPRTGPRETQQVAKIAQPRAQQDPRHSVPTRHRPFPREYTRMAIKGVARTLMIIGVILVVGGLLLLAYRRREGVKDRRPLLRVGKGGELGELGAGFAALGREVKYIEGCKKACATMVGDFLSHPPWVAEEMCEAACPGKDCPVPGCGRRDAPAMGR